MRETTRADCRPKSSQSRGASDARLRLQPSTQRASTQQTADVLPTAESMVVFVSAMLSRKSVYRLVSCQHYDTVAQS